MKASLVSDDGALRVEVGDKEVVVGRGKGASAQLDVPTLDRRHAKLICSAGKCTVEDLGSTSGVFVNDRLARRATVLVDGDRLRLGGVVFLVKIGDN